jgi:hypothetical protein
MKEKTSIPVIHEESKRLTSVYCESSVLDECKKKYGTIRKALIFASKHSRRDHE